MTEGPDRSACVDRMADGIAVLQVENGDEFTVPRSWLPDDAREGMWVTITLTEDPRRTATERRAVKELRDRLSDDDDGGDLVL